MQLIKTLNDKVALHRIVPLRHRYLFTRSNKLRLRYIVGTTAIVSMTFTSFLGVINSSEAFAPEVTARVAIHQDGEDLGLDNNNREAFETVAAPLLLDLQSVENLSDEDDVIDQDVAALVEDAEPTLPREDILKINTGDTLAGALQNAGITGADAYKAVKAMSKFYNPRQVKPGQVLSVGLEPSEEHGIALSSLSMKIDPIKEIVIKRDENDRFSASLVEKEVLLQTKAAQTSIESSLYGSAARAGIPASIVSEIIRIYSYEVDFQRDIRSGDKVEVFYETYETEDGEFARYGDVLYAKLNVGGIDIPVYRYEGKEGSDYYREDGSSLKRTIMQTPIDGARMSSGFGMRKHPVLGYNKMHKGVDFAAPRGTPIYAAGDGVVEKAGRNGGYGKYVRIRHAGGLKTAYAHMNKYASGIEAGKRVKQGQIIGYVGTTGRSTGPHLHFEVLRGDKQINPKSVKSTASAKLAGSQLKSFQNQITDIKQRYASASEGLKFARNESEE